jgi:tetratricopeptide (TPR) repeat protein
VVAGLLRQRSIQLSRLRSSPYSLFTSSENKLS